MRHSVQTLFFPVAALLYSMIVVGYARQIAEALRVMDHPGSQGHKAHNKSTPLVGGVAVVPPAIAALLLFGVSTFNPAPVQANIFAIVLATSASFSIGLSDDRQHIRAFLRLLLCGLAFFVAMALSPQLVLRSLSIQTLGLELDLGGFAMPFTIICLLAFQNSVNMADGRNGLVAGISIIWLLTLLSYGAHPSNLAVFTMLWCLIVVLIANMRGRLFLGDAGTYGIGAFVGLVTIWVHKSGIGLLTIDVVTLLMMPVLDMIRLFGYRILQGRHPFAADHSHLHHYLDVSMGWNWGRPWYYMIVVLPIIASRSGIFPGLYPIILGLGLYVGSLAFCAWRAGKQNS